MISKVIKGVSLAVLGGGGVGVALWSSGVFAKPYSSIWKGIIGEPAKDLSFICGLVGNKYDCKLSLSLKEISPSPAGGGKQSKLLT